jgi:mannose-6-phosphate isomerase-like protein (cupin superfamily)
VHEITPRPSIELFGPYSVGAREWGEEIVIAQTDQYLGKVLNMRAGKAGGLQAHRTKIETFFLFSGSAYVDYDKGDGTLTRLVMSAGMSVHVPAGAPHRVTAITDCTFFECSVPVFNDRIRLETAYGEPEVGGLPTTA